MLKAKKTLCVLCALILLVSLFSFGDVTAEQSDELSELQQQRNELQQQLKEIKSNLNSIKNQQQRIKAQIASLKERTDNVKKQIDICIKAIEIAQQDLIAKQIELDQKQRDIEHTYELFSQRLRAMYMSKDSSLLAVFLRSTSISDFFANTAAIRSVSKHDNDLIDRLTREKAEIEQAKAEIQEKLAALEVEQQELQTAFDEMAELIREQNEALSKQEALRQAQQSEYDRIADSFKEVEDEIARLASQSGGSFIGGNFRWPVPGYSYISYGFGYRVHPVTGEKQDYHRGIDIAGWNIWGKPVIASNSGTVVKAEYTSTGYGIYVIIDHGGGISTVYGHLSSISVTKGQFVYQGEKVGEVGSSGNSSGPHLHFSVYINGYAQNPKDYVSYAW